MTLPSKATLTRKVRSFQLGPKAAQSDAFLLKQLNLLQTFGSVEEFACDDFINEKLKSAIEFHFINIRKIFIRTLLDYDICVGVDAMDRLIFSALRDSSGKSIISIVVSYIKDYDIHGKGMLIYPLHSLNITSLGFATLGDMWKVNFFGPHKKFRVCAQATNLSNLRRFLSDTKKNLGICRQLPFDLIEHFHLSRGLEWLTNNPIMVVAISSFPGNYYENQNFIKYKIMTPLNCLYLLSALGGSDDDLFGSSKVNNFNTKDIFHFLTLYPDIRDKLSLTADCVPLYASRRMLEEMTDASIDIDFKEWTRRPRTSKRIGLLLQELEKNLVTKSDMNRLKIHEKVSLSLTYFRRSHRKSIDDPEKIVNLATAFEILLIDSNCSDIKGTIRKRMRKIIRGERNTIQMANEVYNLYNARNDAVHRGQHSKVDTRTCRKAYAYTVIRLLESIKQQSISSGNMIHNLLNKI